MAPATINVFLTTFPGLDLPKTLVVPTPSTSSVAELCYQLAGRIPLFNDGLILTTASNRQLGLHSSEPLSSLVTSDYDEFLTLRLSARLCGGKGGFGSQLRAAGGRMSSKKKRNQGDNNGSSRNLDGRRLRTVTEAKALAEYLAIKPDMEKKEKEQRRRRWEQVVELAERREEEIKSGSKGKVDGKWVEDKEEAGERTREAVQMAIRSGDYRDNLLVQPRLMASITSFDDTPGSGNASTSSLESNGFTLASESDPHRQVSRSFFGFDEDDEFMSDDENEDNNEIDEASEDDEKEPVPEVPTPTLKLDKGKGKAKSDLDITANAATKTRTKQKQRP